MAKKQLMPLLNEMRPRTLVQAHPIAKRPSRGWTWLFSADQILLLIVIGTGICLFVAWLWWLRSNAQI